ncbi:MAG: copper resistance protein CopC [Chloroflexota bacterium]|nr:copper resistance protein CopC [Chloroflexota bacterium]
MRHPHPLITLFLLVATLAAAGLILPSGVDAHATLVEADPPVDGLVLSSPGMIRLTFSEEVRATNPAPSILIQDESGQSRNMSDQPVGPFDDDRRVLSLDVLPLDPGTYTVTWTATSATDGHELSGTYAFRVGGGLPPGLATTEDEAPAPWAVATRWISFLGAAISAGLFLFDRLILRGRDGARWWATNRSLVILGAAIFALLATLAEPALQARLSAPGAPSDIDSAIRGLPGGWWWRPAMLIPLVGVAGSIVISKLERLPALVAWLGTSLALGSLLGLVFTSHAAGRESLRGPALASNVLHQWSTALWIGGIVAIVVWLAARRGAPDNETVTDFNIQRFSSLALGLFAIATITGLINAGFVFPFVESIREDGVSLDTFSPLWTSRYGIVLLIKIAALLIPLCLAIVHRSAVQRMAQSASRTLANVPGRMRSTLRWEAAAVMAVVLGGSTIALSAPPAPEDTVLDRVTLVAPARTEAGKDAMLAHLTVDPARQGANRISVYLTDAMGTPLPNDPKPNISLDFLSLDHGTTRTGVDLGQDPADPAAFTTSGLDLSMEGWWQITASIERIGSERASAPFYVLLPDPNTTGLDDRPDPDTEPDAEAVFQRGVASMTSWNSVRWTESLGSGADVLVVARFAITDGKGNGPAAYDQETLYSGGFEPYADGSMPPEPTMNSRRSITVGDRGWLRTTSGKWLEEPPGRFAVPSEWGSIYSGSTNIRLGTSQVINGEDAQIITFHSPDRPDQSEAWFAWWVGKESGNVLQVTMIARNHYMVWQYVDINGDIRIEPPVPS